MTSRHLTLLFAPALPLAPALLLLSACGEEPGGRSERREAPSAPLGFELAMAGAGAVGDSRDALADAPPQTNPTVRALR